MRLVSTRGRSPPVDLRTALFEGLAPDGGLYMPERLDPLAPEVLEGLRGAAFSDVAEVLVGNLFGDDLADSAMDRLTDALDFPVPLVELADGVRVLELFHGPTLAFKDVGARFMAGLIAGYLEPGTAPLTVLVATSGDTGGAVAHAFLGAEGVRTVVLFPGGGVSHLQQRQFTTLGGNASAVAVDGTFDDCQSMVKAAFANESLRASVRLTSANSINVGRLIPQMFYYAHAWAQLPPGTGPPLFSIPSGNFGNLAAALMARRMGVPAAGFVAATNVNDVVPEYLESGALRPRPSRQTISNAMDVGNPSNFERIRALCGDDLGRLRSEVVGSAHTDDETRRCIADVVDRAGYVLDPHSAVGYLGLQAGRRRWPQGSPIVLATAHPAKFPEVVELAIGGAVTVPARLAERLNEEAVVQRIPAEPQALEELLSSSRPATETLPGLPRLDRI
ncbi:MAG: threonine synthase [Gemmatimonadota bacterium]|nr:MAG: threonine synthase [Gemmatimonadota bacterium]